MKRYEVFMFLESPILVSRCVNCTEGRTTPLMSFDCCCEAKTRYKIVMREYATNDNGEGLFILTTDGLKQLHGNMQWLTKDKKSLLRQLNSICSHRENERFFGTENGARNYLKKNNLEEIK